MSALPPQLIGTSPAFLATMDRVSHSAALGRSMLVVGERGTGKELIAARLHFLSPRWDKTYLTLNCAALSEELLDSELFGHEAGAFTGASKRRLGRFERADGGTLFLDEIATASTRVQEKLLRIIEYGEFERLGGEKTIKVDVRVIGATNIDLPAAAKAGEFRADLLDRLSFDVITLPPLRVRRADITPLAEHFGRSFASELGAESFPGFAPDILDFMQDYEWPGNVRELKNVAERATGMAILDDNSFEGPINDITLDPFATPWRPLAGPIKAQGETEQSDIEPEPLLDTTDFTKRVMAYEFGLVKEALLRSKNHQGRAADYLGLTYHAFRGLLRKHDLRK
ncbi:MAG: phage shock protein operon transcriptional activator [Robiginitomaculum sp.]